MAKTRLRRGAFATMMSAHPDPAVAWVITATGDHSNTFDILQAFCRSATVKTIPSTALTSPILPQMNKLQAAGKSQ